MVMHFELPRHKLQHATDLFADTALFAMTDIADFLFR